MPKADLSASDPRLQVACVPFGLHAEDPDAFARALGSALRRHGFAVILDPGLEPAVVEAALAEAKALFALPDADKLAHAVPGGSGQRGYTALGRENAKGAATGDLKEFWHIGRDLSAGHPARAWMADNVWPNERPGFRPAMEALYTALDELGCVVIAALARHLGTSARLLAEAVQGGDSILRLLHYPPVAADAPGVRAGAHEDIDALTLLLGAEEAGLELLDRDGRWLPVDPPPGAVVCNVGDMLQRLTNHVLPSTTHRVVNPPAERRAVARYSMPFFLHFRPDFVIRTLPGCTGPGRPDRYPEPITAHAYLQERLHEIGLA